MSLPESMTDALIECVKGAGGSKVVSHKIWPEKMVDQAQRHLLNCLQDGRAERLTPEQVHFVFRLAHDAGCHVGMEFLCASLGYAPPTPVKPQDEAAQLQREFIAATRHLGMMAERIAALQGQQPVHLKAAA